MPLEVVRPGSVRAAAAVLAADSHARFMGGGTLLVRAHNSGNVSIGRLILSDGLPINAIRVEGGRAEIGAAVTMAEILNQPKLAFLHDVAREIGGPAIRAMATVGGNLFARSPYGDLAVALLALGAEVTSEDAKTERDFRPRSFPQGAGEREAASSQASALLCPSRAPSASSRSCAGIRMVRRCFRSPRFCPSRVGGLRGRASPTVRWRRRRSARAP